MIESLSDPAQRHAMLAHLPIAISVLGVLLAIALLIRAGRSPALRWILVSFYGLGALLSYLAQKAGGEAHHKLDVVGMTQQATHLFEEHAQLGSKLWMAMLACAVLALLTLFKHKAVRWTTSSLVLIATLATAMMVAEVAHHGGQMVYDQGVGVPTSPNNVNPDTVGHDHDEQAH